MSIVQMARAGEVKCPVFLLRLNLPEGFVQFIQLRTSQVSGPTQSHWKQHVTKAVQQPGSVAFLYSPTFLGVHAFWKLFVGIQAHASTILAAGGTVLSTWARKGSQLHLRFPP